MKTATQMTEKQRLAVEAMEGAQTLDHATSLHDTAYRNVHCRAHHRQSLFGRHAHGDELAAPLPLRRPRQQSFAPQPRNRIVDLADHKAMCLCVVAERDPLPDRGIARVYLHRAPVDMRKQIDGLVILAKDVIQQDPTSGALFGFINARRNKLKLLVWERNGFIIWYKRLERDKFHWPRRAYCLT